MALVWLCFLVLHSNLIVFLLIQHIVSALGIIEDILLAVDSLVLSGFDMATTCLFFVNALHSYICIFIVFFIISEVMLQPVLLHIYIYICM